ncbi:hypothetical protein LTR95_002188 [Oleoguttula sp. CCFEE 5521]
MRAEPHVLSGQATVLNATIDPANHASAAEARGSGHWLKSAGKAAAKLWPIENAIGSTMDAFWQYRIADDEAVASFLSEGRRGSPAAIHAIRDRVLDDLTTSSPQSRATMSLADVTSAVSDLDLFPQRTEGVAGCVSPAEHETHVLLVDYILEGANCWSLPDSRHLEVGWRTPIRRLRHFSSERARSAGSFNTASAAKLGAFTHEDLDIAMLQKIGVLDIVWTYFACEHLKLQGSAAAMDDTSSDDSDEDERPRERRLTPKTLWYNTENVSWLTPTLLNWNHQEAIVLAREVGRTHSFHLNHKTSRQTARARKPYKQLPILPDIAELLTDASGRSTTHLQTLGNVLTSGLDVHLPVMRQRHLSPMMRKHNMYHPDAYRYELFKTYGHRIHRLRKYMDAKKL